MLMGLPPFMSDDLGKLFTQIIKKKPPAIIIDDTKIEDDLRDLIRKLLQKSPDKRYQKAVDVSAELGAIQNKFHSKTIVKDNQFTSLSFRWATIMASVALIAMAASMAVVYLVQNKALSGVTFDYGRSTTQMIAAKMAVPMTLEDPVGLKVMVDESSENELVRSIDVIDLDNIVLASTSTQRVNQLFKPPANRVLESLQGETNIYRRQLDNKEILFDIDLPIYFADKQLGKIYISYTTNTMYEASKKTLASIFSVMLVTLLIILMITLVLARKTSKDFQRVTQALNKMAMGRMDARLISDRKDEAGQMFQSFNRLASHLERYLNADVNNLNEREISSIKKSNVSRNRQLDETLELDIGYQEGHASSKKVKTDNLGD
jgi:serine/threonine-protein kinase